MGDIEVCSEELEDLLTFLAYDEPNMMIVGQTSWSTFFEIQQGVRMQVSLDKEQYIVPEGVGSERLVRSETVIGGYSVFLIMDTVKQKIYC